MSQQQIAVGHNTRMLNPNLDVSALATEFRKKERIQIADIFDADVAESLHQCLQNEIPWRLSCWDNTQEVSDQAITVSQEAMAAMRREQRTGFLGEVLRQARDQFQYLYQSFDLVLGHRAGEKPDLYVYNLMKYLAGDEFFEFARSLTANKEIAYIDGHATRYVARHFLKEHSDESPFERRRLAYVISMTRDWTADMGGLTQFMNDEGGVVDCFVPTFNTFTVFSVPVKHMVSYVPPWVSGERLSVTGWLTIEPE